MSSRHKPNQHHRSPASGPSSPAPAPHGQPIAAQRAAQHVARQPVEHAYRDNPPNQLSSSSEAGDPYNRTHQPIYDWQRYHTAWQKYYQRYFQYYYDQQLQAERARHAAELAAKGSNLQPQLSWQTVTGSDQLAEPKSTYQQLQGDLLRRVRDRARAFKSSNHFMPILSALIVGLLFLFLQYNRLLAAQVEAYISPGSTVDASDTVVVDPAQNANVGPEAKIIIPKINVNVPVVYDVTTTDEKPVQAALEKGAVHYKLPGANSVPGQAGNGVLLGHSSNDVFDPGGYKFAFVLIDRLQQGDVFYLNYQGKRYAYRVSDKKIINPTDWRVLQQNNGKPTVVLVTCNPPGTSLHRLLVYGEQVSPDPASVAAKPAETQGNSPATIPGSSSTFFERLRDIFF